MRQTPAQASGEDLGGLQGASEPVQKPESQCLAMVYGHRGLFSRSVGHGRSETIIPPAQLASIHL